MNLQRILLITFCAAACNSIVLAQQASPNYWIAYNVQVDGKADNYDVFGMEMDGRGKKNITNHKDVAWAYYAHKNTLYFISDRDSCRRCYFLYATEDGGKSLRKVTDLRLEDSWMSARNNGAELVVTGRIGTTVRQQVFLIDVRSGAYRQITNDTSAMYGDPVFSPDGKDVVYRYRKQKRNRQEKAELWIMNLESGVSRQLTHYPVDDTTAAWHAYHAGPPRWHPTEHFISYQSFQNGKYRLYAITPDGKKHWKLLTTDATDQGWHDWSDDGQWLAFEGFDTKQTQFDIYLMNWKTKDLKRLTDSTHKFQQAPVFVRVR
ncbi:MAG: PD40 domain-containing protein [Ignavibacteriae bacterium]|nr:PD40 domain-containing protein [Ignavibacteriota bacterium]